MSEEKELKFVRLRNLPDDLVGYVTYGEECVFIEQPLRVEVETYFEESRQILSIQEYLPQAIIELKELEIPNKDILFTTPVKPEFAEQYEQVADFFYNNQTRLKNNKTEIPKEALTDAAEKVVSILEALQSKKDKPIH